MAKNRTLLKSVMLLIGIFLSVYGGAVLAQPSGGSVWVYEFSLDVAPVSLTYAEKLRDANKPVPEKARPKSDTRQSGGKGFITTFEEIDNQIDGYKIVETTRIGDQNLKIWARGGSISESSAPAGRFDDIFEGQATAKLNLSGSAQFKDPQVILVPKITPSYTFGGIAEKSEEFQKEFKSRVEAKIQSFLQDLQSPMTLSEAEQEKLARPRGGRIVKTRKVTFFDQTAELKITITSTRKTQLNIPPGQ